MDDLALIERFLARRDPVTEAEGFDVLVLCGSGVLVAVAEAAAAFHTGVARHLLVTGGLGHSTPYLVEALSRHPAWYDVPTAGRTEAAMIAEVLRRHLDVPDRALTLEEQATNCGENAEHSLRILGGMTDVGRVLLVQDPTMQRRTHASFDHHQRLRGTNLEVVSRAPVVRREVAWTLDRFVELALGEVRRLHDDAHGYGPLGAGFIDHVDVPEEVLAAAERVAQAFPNLRSRPA